MSDNTKNDLLPEGWKQQIGDEDLLHPEGIDCVGPTEDLLHPEVSDFVCPSPIGVARPDPTLLGETDSEMNKIKVITSRIHSHQGSARKSSTTVKDLRLKIMLKGWCCEECGQAIKRIMRRDCTDCGGGIGEEELMQTLLGLDVVGLFPAMKSKTTGAIVRKMVVKSEIKIRGFNWKHGVRYIALNKHLTGDLGILRRLLPWTKSGMRIGMRNKNLNSKKEKIEETWCFPMTAPTEEEEKEIAGRVAEIGMRTVFKNFTYKFWGSSYRQRSGGPIGARVTMAASRLVMQDWGSTYRVSLELAKMEVGLLSGYVDDVRQGGTCLRWGLRFEIEKKEWRWTECAMLEDEEKNKEGESNDERMIRICHPLMNSINPDLEFTAEIASEFANKRLPTLDFELWLETDGTINHSYFQKPMKTQYITMKRSAMAQTQKMSILSNEMVRRLSNINHLGVEKEEILKVGEQFIRELKVSGYNRKEAREIVVSGMTGWQRKIKRREEDGGEMYKNARSTLPKRCRKKLLEKTNWYKKRKRDSEDDGEKYLEDGERRGGGRKKIKKERINKQRMDDGNKVKAVMFVPYTTNSELAKQLREAEEKLLNLTGYKLKIVERAGTKLEDMLPKSNPWQGKDCGRELCLLCETKQITEENQNQDCSKRSVVYEMWCMSCYKEDEDKIKMKYSDNPEKMEEEKRKIKKYKYIGESARSVFERALEHQLGFNTLNKNSYMLKHTIEKHEGEELEQGRFGIKILKATRSAFERQILESVLLQENVDHFLLNSKAEYNRCAIPRLTTKIGERLYERWQEDGREEKKKEAILEEKIRNLRRKRNGIRKEEIKEDLPPMKKRRVEGNEDPVEELKEKKRRQREAKRKEEAKNQDIRDSFKKIELKKELEKKEGKLANNIGGEDQKISGEENLIIDEVKIQQIHPEGRDSGEPSLIGVACPGPTEVGELEIKKESSLLEGENVGKQLTDIIGNKGRENIE